MSIDWDKAPEGATHFHYGNAKHSPHWRKRGYYCVTDFEHLGWRGDNDPLPVTDYVERPQPEPKPWSGPEDGLPPVGERVDYMGEHCTVVAHVMERNEKGAILQGADDWFYGTEITIDPIRTAADIAAEKRENAIRELMDIAQVDCRVTAARLVDAGFKMPSKALDRDTAVSDLASEIGGYYGDEHSDCSLGQKRLAAYLHDQGFKREVV